MPEFDRASSKAQNIDSRMAESMPAVIWHGYSLFWDRRMQAWRDRLPWPFTGLPGPGAKETSPAKIQRVVAS